MKIANLNGRAIIVGPTGSCDIEEASGGRFSSDPDAAISRLSELRQWWEQGEHALDESITENTLATGDSRLGPPVTRPGQIFAVGLNYRSHSDETGLAVPGEPMIFTKFASSLAGPYAAVPLPGDTVDWEVELVAVIGRAGRNIETADALDHVAGYCVGQDLSERTLQFRNTPAQFSLAKSFQAFAPIGPWLTTADEVADVADLEIGCAIDERDVQRGHTSLMIFDVPTVISYLSRVCELRTGDLIFTGTPDGVGFARKPPQYLLEGTTLISTISGLGTLRNAMVAGKP